MLCAAWTARVPAPVAEAAIERGIALDADTDAAREKMKEMAELRRRISPRLGPAVTIEDTIDLGVNLAEQVEPRKFGRSVTSLSRSAKRDRQSSMLSGGRRS